MEKTDPGCAKKMSDWSVSQVIENLKANAHPENLEGMRRYGINTREALGINVPVLEKMAKEIGIDHPLAMELWETGIHDARILAGFIADPTLLSEAEMEAWVKDFDSWDVCDLTSSGIFDQSPFAIQKAFEWSGREEEFVRRAGFVIMAGLSVHSKTMTDEQFEAFFKPIIERSNDERNFVKKAVNWALRNIGKRNRDLNQAAIDVANKLLETGSRSARWIARDALRELTSDKVRQRLTRMENKKTGQSRH
jgi:3-methyladenine DNA glycosylase AlkD